ncbi:MAG: periplasmic heavy metal sensor [Desulfobacterales bacterium]|jgi:zinc resistance-associated protein
MMYELTLKKGFIMVAVIATVGFVASAFAGWGAGGFGHRRGGWHHMGWGGSGDGYGYNQNLTNEQQKALDQERQAFLNASDSIRQDLSAKNLELRSELAKDNPDAQKAAALQKEISKLESDLDQKQLDFMLDARKVAPDAGRGHMMGGMMGYGPGYGSGAARRGGYCWE